MNPSRVLFFNPSHMKLPLSLLIKWMWSEFVMAALFVHFFLGDLTAISWLHLIRQHNTDFTNASSQQKKNPKPNKPLSSTLSIVIIKCYCTIFYKAATLQNVPISDISVLGGLLFFTGSFPLPPALGDRAVQCNISGLSFGCIGNMLPQCDCAHGNTHFWQWLPTKVWFF